MTALHSPLLGGRLVDLDAAECWALLHERTVGRLAWTGPDGVTVVPVNYVVEGDTVIVRTTAYSTIARECDDLPLAFEVDDLDEEARNGWSVLARGRGHLSVAADATVPAPDAWPAGPRPVFLHVEVDRLTGRRLEAV